MPRRTRTTPYVRRTGPPCSVVTELLDRAAAHGLTPFALSRAIGAHPSVLNRWRNGTSPRMDALQPYVDYVNGLEQ